MLSGIPLEGEERLEYALVSIVGRIVQDSCTDQTLTP